MIGDDTGAPGDGQDPHILLVTKLLPTPPDTGGKLRTLALATRLAARGPVTMVAFDEGDADIDRLDGLGIRSISTPWLRRPVELLAGALRSGSLTSARFWHPDLAAATREVAEAHPDGSLVVEFAHLEPWVRHAPARRRILATQNVESVLLERMAATSRFPKREVLRLEAAALARLERRLYRTVDAVSVVSGPDADLLAAGRLGADPPEIVVSPNGIDLGDPLPVSTEPVVAFVASMGWTPNVDAACWFVGEVWPKVRAGLPDARLLLVGRSPAPPVRALAGPDVEVTGTVPDVTPYLSRARVALAPLRAGGGTRLKILEALGAGRPVVATSIGAEGLEDLVGRGIVIADDPADMAGEILGLLADASRAASLGAEGHEAVSARYGWDASLAPLLAALD